MNLAPMGLHGGPEDTPIDEPKAFVRTLTTPSGLPWEQARAAELDARMGAPATLAALRYRLVRIEGWRFGQPGRFAAVYLRGGDIVDGYETDVIIEGRSTKVAFVSDTARRRALIAKGRIAALIAAPIALVLLAVTISFAVGADREDQLATLEARAQRSEALARRFAAEKAETRLLQRAGVDGHAVSDALRDLDWLSRTKAPDAHIQAVHWEGGLMTITVRGETPPVRGSEREVRKASRPLGTGLWLWGIGPAGGVRP